MMRRISVLLVLACGLGVSAYYLWKLAEDSSAWGGWTPMSGASWWGIPLAVALQVAGHCLRAKKSDLLLRVVRPTGFVPLLRGLSIGFLFNTLLPFRLGELVRAHVTGKEMSISRGVVFFTILFERAVDGILLSFCALGVWLLWGAERPAEVGTIAGLAVAVFLVSVAVAALTWFLYMQDTRGLRLLGRWTAVFNERIRDRLRFVLWSVIYGIHLIFRSARLGRYVALSAVMWGLYLLSMLALLQDVSPQSGLSAKFAASVSTYLSVSVPSGPAFLGTFHYYFSTLTRGFLGTQGAPLALSVVAWVVLMVPFALVGLGFLLKGHKAQPSARPESLEHLKHKLHRDQDLSREFSQFLDEYFSGQQLSHVLSRREMAGDFKMVRTFKGGSNASTLLALEGDQLLVKKVTLRQHAEKLKAQFDWLRRYSHLPNLPRAPKETFGEDYYAFDLEFRADFVPYFDYIHSESLDNSRKVLEGVLDFMAAHIYELKERTRSPEDLQRYLDDKVEGKVRDAAAMDPVLATLVREETLVINGRACLNLDGCLAKLRELPRALEDLATFHRTPIHGDLTVDNIIVSRKSGEFLVLDPNNENAISDPVVDLGKLCQSLHSGYEFLVQLERARVDGNVIHYEESASSRYSALYEHLRELIAARFPPDAVRSVLFHEAVHYCRMLTYRARINPDSLPAFYATAVKLFNDFIAQYEGATVTSLPLTGDVLSGNTHERSQRTA